MTVKPLSSILIKPAGPDCNLACRYCFYLKKSEMFSELKTHRMSDDVLKETVKQMMRDGEQQVAFGWQGGEPTLMGRKFLKAPYSISKNSEGRASRLVMVCRQTEFSLIRTGRFF